MVAWTALIVALIALIGLILHSVLAVMPDGVAHRRNPINDWLASRFSSFYPTGATAQTVTGPLAASTLTLQTQPTFAGGHFNPNPPPLSFAGFGPSPSITP